MSNSKLSSVQQPREFGGRVKEGEEMGTAALGSRYPGLGVVGSQGINLWTYYPPAQSRIRPMAVDKDIAVHPRFPVRFRLRVRLPSSPARLLHRRPTRLSWS